MTQLQIENIQEFHYFNSIIECIYTAKVDAPRIKCIQ